MFETHESARLAIPVGFADHGEYVWGYAYTRLFMHWFHAVVRSKYEHNEYQESRNLLLTQADDIVTLNKSDEWEIKEVSLVSPGHMNKSSHWQMGLLDEILVGRESQLDHEQYGYIFVLNDGQRYIVSLNKSEDELIDIASIYRAND
ncbi:MAG: hypothetical protein GY938_13815 [Ketobacter sp.]|nr:hypothetical protein [Ketobacter sp.]